MFQQIIAIIIILFFIVRMIWQKKNKKIKNNEFVFWLIFWGLAFFAITSLKWIDKIVANLGFTGSGIDILLYIAIIILFHLVIKIRFNQVKINNQITKLTRKIALDEKD